MFVRLPLSTETVDGLRRLADLAQLGAELVAVARAPEGGDVLERVRAALAVLARRP